MSSVYFYCHQESGCIWATDSEDYINPDGCTEPVAIKDVKKLMDRFDQKTIPFTINLTFEQINIIYFNNFKQMKKNYSGEIELTKMQCAITTTAKGTRVLMIPIKENHLDEFTEGRIAIPVNIVIHEEADKYGNAGFIGQKVASKEYKTMTDEQKKATKLPILGNFKDFSGSDNTAPAPVVASEKDLPF